MSSNVLFITGTDTGVGKTAVGAALVKRLAADGFAVGVLKPVETGCRQLPASSELFAEDAALLAEAAGVEMNQAVLYRYPDPVAPMVAAKRAGQIIQPASILKKISELSAANDLVVVEGAGGLAVPLTESYLFSDLATECSATALVVIGSRLGCLNHALLTFESLRTRGVPCLGYVLNNPFAEDEQYKAEGDLAVQTNRESLRQLAAKLNLSELANFQLQAAAGKRVIDTLMSDPDLIRLSNAVRAGLGLKAD